MQAGDDGDVGVTRAAAAAFGEQQHRQALLQRHAEQPIGLLVVAHSLRAGQHGGVVSHHDAARRLGAEQRAVHAANARHHAVGRRVAHQIVMAAPARLRGHRERTVFNEAAGVAQVGDVFARTALAARVAPGDRLGTLLVERERMTLLHLVQVGAQRWAVRSVGADGVGVHRGKAALGGACQSFDLGAVAWVSGSLRRRATQGETSFIDAVRRHAAWRTRRVCAGAQMQQQVPFRHGLAGTRDHAQDMGVGLRADLVFHLHGLDDQQQLAGAHRVASSHRHLDHRARHRRVDHFLCHAGLLASHCSARP